MDKNKLELCVLAPGGSGIGPDYVPKILAVCLVVLCVIKMAQVIYAWRKKPDEHSKFTVDNLPTVCLVLLCLVAYFILWTVFGLFYPATFLAVCGIMLVCAPKEKRWTPKFLAIDVGCSAAFLVLIYVLFTIGMDVRF